MHPAAIAHRDPRSALIIGGGDGGAAEELLKHPGIERIVLAELDEAVVRIAREYLQRIHRGALDDPRVELRIGDGMTYVQQTEESFDLVLLDLTDPDTPASALYGEAFFAALRRVLKPGGAMVLHMGSPIFTPDSVRMIHRRLTATFGCVAPLGLYIPLYGAYWSLAVCSDSLDPRQASASLVSDTLAGRRISDRRYYNPATDQARIALPGYYEQLLA